MGAPLLAAAKSVALLVVAAVTFWSQATVAEDFFVPALNILSTHLGISPDVAAATIMAAGSASPNLLAVVVSTFVTKSSLGFGTIVGSEMFQQLFCVAAAVMSVRGHGGRLVLSPVSTGREIGFYALSLVLLGHALGSVGEGDEGVVRVTTWDGVSLLVAYVFYVVVCVKFDALVGKPPEMSATTLSKVPKRSDKSSFEQGRATPSIVESSFVESSPLPFLRQLRYEPQQNFVDDNAQGGEDTHIRHRSGSNDADHAHFSGTFDYDDADILEAGSGDQSVTKVRRRLKRFLCLPLERVSHGNRHSSLHDLDDVDTDSRTGDMSCFMWQQSLFHDHASLAGWHAWQLRWFTFTSGGPILSVPDRILGAQSRGSMVYPDFDHVQVDPVHLTIRFCTGTGIPDITCMAPNYPVLVAITGKLRETSKWHTESQSLTTSQADLLKKEASLRELTKAEMESVPSLIEYPHGSPLVTVAIHVILFPVKWLMHVTIPDVRVQTHGMLLVRRAVRSVLICMAWLIICSLAMVSSLETVADIAGIPEHVVGVTLSAVGTSIPICVASVVSARKGLGNAAVANVLGSSTFNILVGLGLPWTIYAAMYGGYKLDSEGANDTFILIASLLVFILMVFWGRFVLSRWHAMILAGLYVAYLACAVFGVV